MRRLQSAMEYLMTYGWAVLIIAVVLGALYQLGIFGTTTNALQSSCFATTGFYCTTPIMNTTGFLGIVLGQLSGQQITITSVACTRNVSTPSFTQNAAITIPSGSKAALAFSCPTTGNSIGTAFKGYLWITYNSPTQTGIIDRFAIVTGKIQTTGNVTKAQQASGQGGTTTTTTSTSTTTVVSYTWAPGSMQHNPNGLNQLQNDVTVLPSATGNTILCTGMAYRGTITGNFVTDASAGDAIVGHLSPGSVCTDYESPTNWPMQSGGLGFAAPPGTSATTFTQNAVSSTATTLSYTVASGNSFVAILATCGSTGQATCTVASLPSGCTNVVSQYDDGGYRFWQYAAVCQSQSAGAYPININVAGGSMDIAAAAYVYH